MDIQQNRMAFSRTVFNDTVGGGVKAEARKEGCRLGAAFLRRRRFPRIGKSGGILRGDLPCNY